MLGAIVGDIVGSSRRSGAGGKTTQVAMFGKSAECTDNGVMTLAVAKAMMDNAGDEGKAEAALVAEMRAVSRRHRHPKGGYAGRFLDWVTSPDPAPYGRNGNGSATRVSAVGWMFDTLEDVERWAAVTARATHNHPEGIKGAQATAAAIFLVRTQGSGEAAKGQLRSYIENRFGYDLSRTINEIRPDHKHVKSCQETVPEAITAYLEADGFERTLRLAVSLGGDTGALAAIAGAIAEAAYGVPMTLRDEALRRLPGDLRAVLDRFSPTVERRRAQRVWALLAPYADWLDSRPTTPWRESRKGSNGVTTLGYPIYDERIREVQHAFSENGLMVYDYLAELRRRRIGATTPEDVSTADIDTLLALFTLLWRSERFGDGNIAGALQSGRLAAMSNRARSLAGD